LRWLCGARAGRRLVRINLSEQTDMMDLLGADLPVEGGAPGEFAWCVSARWSLQP
jgi:midasin (ATPase involved in ribosome maturation)